MGIRNKLKHLFGSHRSHAASPLEEMTTRHVEPMGEEPIKGFQPPYQGTHWYDEHRPPK